MTAQQQPSGTPSHSLMVEPQTTAGNPPIAVCQVVDVRHGGTLSDLSREIAIQHEEREEANWRRVHADTGCFSAAGAADRAKLRREELIRGRSASKAEGSVA
jgi:hypothetical protein